MTHLEKYNDIILNSLSQNRNKLKKSDQNYVYYENHHITPKCLGGGNEKDNLVLLTAQEHFIAHKLLTKIYPDNRKIACAFFRMCHDNKNRKISSTDYKYAKELLSMIGHTKETKKKISKSLSGKFQSKESCIKRSNTCKEKNLHKGDKNPMYGKSGTMLGKFHSMESKQKMKKPKSDEHKKNISKSKIGKPSKMKGKKINKVWVCNKMLQISMFIKTSDIEEFLKNNKGFHKGRIISESQKKKQSKAMKGNIPWNKPVISQ